VSACPHCGCEERLRVRMSPLKARIFDAIKRAGNTGISADDLWGIAFAGRSRSRETLKAHVWQINDMLAATDWRVRWISRCYRLLKRRV
jgi:hypothetical protein